MRLSERDERRFWSKVALPSGEGHMLWAAGQAGEGYGQFWLNGRNELAEKIRNSKELRDYTDDHMSDCLMAADLIDPKKEGQ